VIFALSEFEKHSSHSLDSFLERNLQELRGWLRLDQDHP